MSEVTLIAETGRQHGTRPSRRLRAQDRIPGVIYGGGEPALPITFDRKALRLAMTTDAGRNALVTVRVDGDAHVTLVREVQRHPVRREVTHVDFIKVDVTKPMEADIPVHLVGEALQVTRNGGHVEQILNEITVLVRPDQIPDSFEVDITELTLDDYIFVADVPLPEGAEFVTGEEQPVVIGSITRAALSDEEEAEEAEEGEEGAESVEAEASDSDGDES